MMNSYYLILPRSRTKGITHAGVPTPSIAGNERSYPPIQSLGTGTFLLTGLSVLRENIVFAGAATCPTTGVFTDRSHTHVPSPKASSSVFLGMNLTYPRFIHCPGSYLGISSRFNSRTETTSRQTLRKQEFRGRGTSSLYAPVSGSTRKSTQAGTWKVTKM